MLRINGFIRLLLLAGIAQLQACATLDSTMDEAFLVHPTSHAEAIEHSGGGTHYRSDVEIRTSELGPQAIAIGAATLALEKAFAVPNFFQETSLSGS